MKKNIRFINGTNRNRRIKIYSLLYALGFVQQTRNRIFCIENTYPYLYIYIWHIYDIRMLHANRHIPVKVPEETKYTIW